MGEFREKAAHWLDASALALLTLSVLLFIWMWVRAYMQGDIPQGGWGHYESNHGPWRDRFFLPATRSLEWFWWQILNIQFYAFAVGVFSMCFKPGKQGFMIACSAFVFGTVFFTTHYWLVD